MGLRPIIRAGLAQTLLFFSGVFSALAAEPVPFVVPLTKIQAADRDAGDQFGVSVAISSNVAVVGAYWDDERGQTSGSAYIFERDLTSGIWTQSRKLTASDARVGDSFGGSVAIDGDSIVIGSALSDRPGAENAGAVYVFQRHWGGPNNWGERQKIVASNPTTNDWFGWSVGIRSNRIVAGAYQPNGDGKSSGAVYSFALGAGESWEERQRLVVTNEIAGAWFGWSLALDGDLLAVGAPLGGTTNSGAAYLFKEEAGSGLFSLWKRVSPNAGRAGDQFGWSVALHGSNLAVGARRADVGTNDTGAVYLFAREGAELWSQAQRLIAADTVSGNWFGESVSLRGRTLLVGVRLADALGHSSGAAYLFQQTTQSGSWFGEKELTAHDGGPEHRFGESVALSDDTLLIGSLYDPAPSFGFAEGAAYLFEYGIRPGLEIRHAPGELIISWTPPLADWILETAPRLGGGAWTNASSLRTSPVRIELPAQPMFYRLRRP